MVFYSYANKTHFHLAPVVQTLDGATHRDRGARWKVGGLTIENNSFTLKIEKRNKIIVFDFQKVGAGAQKSGGAAALPAPPPPRPLTHWINHYPADKYLENQLHYPLDRDLSGG